METIYKYIYTVNKLNSITKAANSLYVSQPALSMAIKKFEDEIGCPIFLRIGKQIKLTPSGEILIKHIENIMKLEENTKLILNDLNNKEKGHIRIGGTQYFSAFILPTLILDFKQKFPKVTIEIIEASSEDLITLLNENKIDLFFSVNDFNDNNFLISDSITDHLFLAIPKKLMNRNKYCLTREDILNTPYINLKYLKNLELIKNIPFVLLKEENNLRKRIKIIFENKEKINTIMAFDQLTTAHFIMINQLAATITTDLLIKQIYDNNNIFYFKYNHPLMIRNFKIISKKNKYIPFVLKEFINKFKNKK